ncbi:MAG: Asp-tRNA(Asn)/Glu-tRNA(Gln) amidotransferase subunit GatC [Bacteroidota bacterium]
MAVTPADVRYMATLARLRFDEADEQRLAIEMSRMLEYMAQLDELDTAGVAPMAHVLDLHDVVRPDEAETRTDRDDALENAPAHDGTYFLVPKVIG